jgi:hypothetical protein
MRAAERKLNDWGREYALSAWVFLRLLGVVYLLAFASLWPQAREQLGTAGGFWALPTLAWWNASDGFLVGLCAAGVVCSLLVVCDVLPTLGLMGAWACYLSLVTVGQDFLSFQWDSLLLETAFLALFLWPGWHVRPGTALRNASSPPSRTVIWLLRWLLFRLMFFAGVVKLASGDPTWHGLTALRYHYETQPLPSPLAWYVHQLPPWWHALETASTLLIELAVPFLIFVPSRWARAGAAGILAGLQVLILLTGNFGFFNLLSIALCVPLLDDRSLRGLVPARWRDRLPSPVPQEDKGGSSVRRVFTGVLAAGIVGLSLAQFGLPLPEPLRVAADGQRSFHVFNNYGLFAVMTTERPEIIVEGSRDGKTWQEYRFRYKPGNDLRRGPGWVWPHLPRLDWQMWFAALGGPESRSPWFTNLAVRLLQGSPEVRSLLDRDPFGDTPPRYVRAVLYDYHFTNGAERRAGNGAVWKREPRGLYLPPVSLDQ